MRDLGTLGGGNSAGLAMNVLGQVTGAADTASGEQHAFRWSP
jgi:probable HAF family extracellular repeat protein